MAFLEAAKERRASVGPRRRPPLGSPDEELLLATIDAAADDKLTCFAIRLALSGHVGIPRENEPDFLTEADEVFAAPQKK